MTIFCILAGCIKLKKLIEIDPFKILDSNQLSLMNKINMARIDKVNKMITDNVPKWKVYLLKKSKFFARFFKIFTAIEPITKLESDVIREKLILCYGKPDNYKQIAETEFRIQDKRKIDGGKNMKQELHIPKIPLKNFDLRMGEGPNSVIFHMYVESTVIHRFKWWLFCQFFPFEVVRWDKNIKNKRGAKDNGTQKKL